jgi:hypothetical protein
MGTKKAVLAFTGMLTCMVLLLYITEGNAQTPNARLETLAKNSEMIVVGKVSNVKSEWNADKTRIHTRVTLDVGEYVKGEKPDKSLVITHLGGEVDGVGELYSNTPVFSKDEEVLIFVKKDSKNNFVVEGGDEGKIKILKNELTGEKIVQENLTLKKLTSRVKSFLEQQEIK